MRSRLQSAITLVVFAAPLALWLSLVSDYTPWGDDWAGYMLQAKALTEGRAAEELAENAVVISSSDVHLGPYAYPWGYPMLLAALGPLVGWDQQWLKLIGAASLLLLSVSSHALARQFFGAWGALAVTALATIQVTVIDAALLIASDLAYTATAVAGLALANRLYSTMLARGEVSSLRVVLLAVVSVISFTIRSNGAVLPIAFVLAFLAAAVVSPGRRRAILGEAMTVGLAVTAGVAIYFTVLPDGSLMHLNVLSFDPRVWVARARDHASSILEILPGGLESKGGAALLLLGVAAVAGRAASRHVMRLLAVGLFVLGHLALLTLFPAGNQGLRYYLPIITPALLIAAVVLQEAYLTVRARLGTDGGRRLLDRVAVASTAVVCLASAVTMAAALRISVERREAERGPYADSTLRMAEYVKALPPEVQVVFRKPRALRYLTGRRTFAVFLPQNLAVADCYVFDPDHPMDQATISELEAAGLHPTVEFPPLRVFERRGP